MTTEPAAGPLASDARLRVVAIDGVLGAGKTTVAKRLSEALALEYLDTGAMYRGVALACVEAGIDLDDGAAVEAVARAAAIDVRSAGDVQVVVLDGRVVTDEIRRPDVAIAASRVATIAGVRENLVARQRDWARARGGGVLEGRDIATVVFPSAPAKIFLTAEVHERATRRHAEQPDRSYEDVLADLQWRDDNDANRAVDPLRIARGATVLDTTGLRLDEVIARATVIAQESLAAAAVTLGAHPPVHATRFARVVFRVGHGLDMILIRVYFRATFEGRENIPKSGAFVLSPVHRSNVDTVVLPGVTRRRMRFLGKQSMWKFAPMGKVFDILGAIKVHRGSTDRESMRACIAALEAGEPLVVYPEGTRKEGPVVEDLFDGAAYLANKVGVPIIPVGIGGSARAMSRSHKLPRPHKMHMIIGKPLYPDKSAGRKAVKLLTAALQVELQRLFDDAQARVEGRRQ